MEPLGAFGRGLSNACAMRILHHLILAFNGTDIRSVEDFQAAVDGYVRSTHGRLTSLESIPVGFIPSPINGIQLLTVKKPKPGGDWTESDFTFGAGDHSMLRSGFSDLFIISHPHSACPKSFTHAMKGPYHGGWLAALFSHLDNCHQIGTYGPPQFPPVGVTILPAVLLVLKHVLNSNRQIDKRKVRLWVNGSYQRRGIDFLESFAPTILAISIKVFIAVALHLNCDLYHIDISNAFQNTPAPPNATGHRLWLHIFPEYVEWYKS